MTQSVRAAPRTTTASSRGGSSLDDGTKLVTTLRDAAILFAERFATVKRWRLLEIAIERLIAAAESGKRDAVKIATDAIEGVLRARHPLCLSAASHQLPWNRNSLAASFA